MSFFPPGLMWILPSALAAAQERRRLLEQSRGGVILGPKLYSLGRLEQESIREMPGLPPQISGPARDMILESLLEKEKGALGWPVDSSAEGLIKRLLSLIDQLKLSGLTPEAFRDLAQGLIPEGRLTALVSIFQGYEELMASRGLIDRPGLRLSLLSALKSGFVPQNLSRINRVELKGFHRLTPFQADLCLALSEAGLSVSIQLMCPEWALDFNRDSDDWHNMPFLETLGSAARLEASGGSNINLELYFTDPVAEAASWRSVPRRLNNLYSPDPEIREGDYNGLELMAAAGRYAEVEEIGRKVDALLEQGVGPESIALAVRDLGVYGPLVEDVFRRFRLPLFFRRGAPLAIQAPVRAINALLNLAGSNWNRELVLDLIASPYLELGFETPWSSISTLTALAGVTDERAGGGWEANLRRLAQSKTRYRDDVEKILAGINRLKSSLRPLASPLTWTDFVEKIISLMEEFGFSRLIQADVEFIHRDSPAWKMLNEILHELVKAADKVGRAEELHPPEYFSRKLLSAVEEYNVGPTFRGAGGIMVAAVHDLHGLSFDYLFLAGLNEGEFPRTGTENIFFTDNQAAELNARAGRRVLSTTSSETRQEELMFFHALASAEKGLFLSFTRMDSQGRARLPSSLLDEVRRLWPENGLSVDEPTARVIPDLERALTREEIFGGLATRLHNGGGSSAEQLLNNVVLSRPELRPEWESINRRILIERNRTNGVQGSFVGRLDPDILAPWLESLPMHQGFPLLSPTFMEQYGLCPFMFWSARIIGLEPPEEAPDELDPRNEGQLIHSILKEFLLESNIKGLLPLKDTPEERQRLRLMAEKFFRRAENSMTLGREPLWEAKKRNIRRILDQWFNREPDLEGAFVPTLFEWDFRPGGAASPLEVELLSGGKVFFQGRVDRVDISQDMVRVLDYKLSSNIPVYKDLLKPEQFGAVSFQAPVYLAVAARQFGLPVEAAFLLLRDFSSSWMVKFAPQDETLLCPDHDKRRAAAVNEELNFYNRVERAWLNIAAGNFFPSPDTGACEYCGYRTACRASSLEAGNLDANNAA